MGDVHLLPADYEPPDFGDIPLVVATNGFQCEIPAPESLMFSAAQGGNASDLSVSRLVAYAEGLAQRAAASGSRYEPTMMRYALGDCIKLFVKCSGPGETLAAQYAKRANRSNDFVVAAEIVDEYRGNHFVPKPPEHALVIHLRLGDVIRGSPVSPKVLLVCSGPAIHHHTIVKSVYELLADAKATNKSRVILVAGSHTTLEPNDPSWFYTLAIHYAFQVAGYDVSLRLEPYPDDDFTYMSYATTFDVGTGGYSRIIASLVELRGGTIVGRRF